MPLLDITDSTATFGTTIPLSQFADLLAAHRAQYDKTLDVEAQGAALLAADFPAQGSAEFVRAVCNWGGYSGIGGRVLKRNDEAVISDCLRRAAGYLSEARPNISEALLSVSALKGLGSIGLRATGSAIERQRTQAGESSTRRLVCG